MNPKDLAHLKDQLRPVADQFELHGADVESFRRYLEEFRQRPVYLVPQSLGPEIHGLWAATDTADYILFEEATTPYHQRHIVLHEGSHMLQGHVGPSLPELAARLVAHLEPKLVRSLLCRTVFSTQEEAEAEVLATLIEERMDQASATSVSSTSPKTTRDITQFFLRNR